MQFDIFVELQGRKKISEEQSVYASFPVLSFKIEPGDNLLMCLLLIYDKPNYIVLGRLHQSFIPKLEDKEYQEWLTILKSMINFNLLNGNTKTEIEYIKNMNALCNSFIADKIDWTQEGFDLISGKYHFVSNGRIERTIQVSSQVKNQSICFDNSYLELKNHNKDGSFLPLTNYMKNYFLNMGDIQHMTDEQVHSYALFNRKRIADYIWKQEENKKEMQALGIGALSSDLESSALASVQLLKYIIQKQFDIELEQYTKKALDKQIK